MVSNDNEGVFHTTATGPVSFKVKASSPKSADNFDEAQVCKEIVFCYINLSNLVCTKGFDTIIFLFSRSLQVWKMRIK